MLMILAKLLNVTSPLILKEAIEGITCIEDEDTICPPTNETFLFVAMYGLIKFSADFTNYVREIPFSNVSSSAEVHIA